MSRVADMRFPGRWLNDRRVMGLQAESFKSFVTSFVWAVENRTDGAITVEDLEFIPRFSAEAPLDLETAGLWEATGDGWVICDYQSTQTSRAEFEVLENARKRERLKKASQRARRRSESVPGDSTGGTSPGQSPVSTQDRKDRLGTTLGTVDRFDEFWTVWPRKVSKPAAIKAWKGASSRANADIIIAAASAYANNPSRPDTQFIPYPATWLKNDGWNDPLPTPPTASVGDVEWNQFLSSSSSGSVVARITDCLEHPGYPIEFNGECSRCEREAGTAF